MPNIEEALRSLRAADRDSKAFEILRDAAGAPLAAVCFHAQQAVEKSLKAVLFLHLIEFRRTHDLVKLAELLRNQGIDPPVRVGQPGREVQDGGQHVTGPPAAPDHQVPAVVDLGRQRLAVEPD